MVESAPPVEDDAADHGRVRWGINAQLGGFIPPAAALIGIEGRIGYQANRFLGVYADLGANAGFGVGASQSDTQVAGGISAVAYWYVGAMAELSLTNFLHLAAGPVVGSGGWAGIAGTATSAGQASVEAVAAAGFMPGLNLKVGLGFGAPKPHTGRRSQFNLGFNLLMLVAPNAAYVRTETTASGGQVEVKSNRAAIGFAPTITLGYDAR